MSSYEGMGDNWMERVGGSFTQKKVWAELPEVRGGATHIPAEQDLPFWNIGHLEIGNYLPGFLITRVLRVLNLGRWRDSLERRQELGEEVPSQFGSPEQVLSQFQRKAPGTKSGAWPESARFLEAFMGFSVRSRRELYPLWNAWTKQKDFKTKKGETYVTQGKNILSGRTWREWSD